MNSLRIQRLGGSMCIICLICLFTACSSARVTVVSVGPTMRLPPGTTLLTLRSPSKNDDIYAVAWSPDGTRIAYGGSNALVYVWNRMTHTLNLTLQGHRGEIWNIAWSPDSKRLATASWDHTV